MGTKKARHEKTTSMEYFSDIPDVQYEGPDSENPFAFRHYNASEVIEGKPMSEWLRYSVCFWHTWRGTGRDMFGSDTILSRPWEVLPEDFSGSLQAREMQIAKNRVRAHFAFCQKLGIQYYCFHDRDVAPAPDLSSDSDSPASDPVFALASMMKDLQDETGVQCLWATANLFSDPLYASGAATSPNLLVFAKACSQVRRAMDVAKILDAKAYLFWGGREGYSSLLNTRLRQELDHYGTFLKMAVTYKKKIDFDGWMFVEPKPREPTSHQYDFDASTVIGFLKTYGLENEFKLNIEANHATLAARSFHHECAQASAYGFLGSIDANQGEPQCGWDTDDFPSDVSSATKVMGIVLAQGGLVGGLNFDAKLRRESTDVEDLFFGHILGMDTWAQGLKAAAKIREGARIERMIASRYESWDSDLGRKIESGETSLEELEEYYLANRRDLKLKSSKQELFQAVLNSYVFK